MAEENTPLPPVLLLTSEGQQDYEAAKAAMESRAAAIRDGAEQEALWFVEHPPLYTAGTSAKADDLLEKRFPVYDAGRGGQYTYHGPGQRVVYVMLDLKFRNSDVRAFVCDLENWIIESLKPFGVTGERREGRVGIWVRRPTPLNPDREAKIAAIGVRVRRWVTFHGISVNLNPDLGHFGGIVPCGIAEHGVTSLADLGVDATMADLDRALAQGFETVFGRSLSVYAPGKSNQGIVA
ncbi:MAG: lipoyl(octanoyl) transferase LipB [Magnetovibrionaceae bacterium]